MTRSIGPKRPENSTNVGHLNFIFVIALANWLLRQDQTPLERPVQIPGLVYSLMCDNNVGIRPLL